MRPSKLSASLRAGPSTVLRASRWLLVALIATLSLPALAAFHSDALIVPSKGIGPFRLGMTAARINAVRRTAPCEVLAIFAHARATRLETNCGGAFRTAEAIMVGLDPARMLLIFGTPDQVTSSDFSNVRGEWLHYLRDGIAFRVMYGNPGSALIQAIAVFQGTAPTQVLRRPVPPISPAPPPGVGE